MNAQATSLPLKKAVKLEFCGLQPLLSGSYMPLWNLLEPIEGHSIGSTVSQATLERKSILVPEAKEFIRGQVFDPHAN